MHSDLALHLVADLLWTGLIVSLPVLGATMLVGVVISVLQVVTQVQELSLTFVPKLVAAAVALLAFGPWALGRLSAFTTRVWSAIPGLVG
jgi:flagellar biosynthetic protein FliQ